jgi:hypothetical protein
VDVGSFGPNPAERTLSELLLFGPLLLWEPPLGHVLPGKPLGRVLSNPLQRLFLAIEYCTVDLMSESVSPSNQGDPTASV